MVVQSSQLRISGNVELNPVQLGSVQSSTRLENTSAGRAIFGSGGLRSRYPLAK